MDWPNLYIPGAGKSGTSSLHEYLNQHPSIFMSRIKEPHYFSRSDYPNGLDEYKQLFGDVGDYAYHGESSTSYMVYPRAIDRIKTCIKNPKFIFVLRNPVERAWSHYWWLRGMGYETLSFVDAFWSDMRNKPEPDRDFVDGFLRHYYYHMGCYARWLRQFLDTFGSDSVYVTTMEQLHNNPVESLNLCTAFLGIENFNKIEPVQKNKTQILKYPRLYYFVAKVGWGNSPTRFVKRLIPSPLWGYVSSWRRNALNKLKFRLNSDSTYPKLDAETRHQVIDTYKDEVRALRDMTDLSLKEWETDFPA